MSRLAGGDERLMAAWLCCFTRLLSFSFLSFLKFKATHVLAYISDLGLSRCRCSRTFPLRFFSFLNDMFVLYIYFRAKLLYRTPYNCSIAFCRKHNSQKPFCPTVLWLWSCTWLTRAHEGQRELASAAELCGWLVCALLEIFTTLCFHRHYLSFQVTSWWVQSCKMIRPHLFVMQIRLVLTTSAG